MLVFIGIILVVATFVPSVSATESKAYSRYKLVSESVSGIIRLVCTAMPRVNQKSMNINKGKRCPSTY